MTPQFSATAKVNWLNSNNRGRKAPPSGPIYAATARFVDQEDQLFSVILRFSPQKTSQMQFPSGSVGILDEVELGFLTPELIENKLAPGVKLLITEGPGIVAECEIKSIILEMKDPVIMQAEYHQRREQLMAKIGSGTAIFRSAPMAVMHNDVEYNFRQDSDFFYLTGFNESEAVAVLAPHHQEHRFILFVQPKEREKEVWTGYRCGVEDAKRVFGADEAYPITELDEKLPQYLEKADRIYYHLGRDRTFNETILKHWQRLMATYPKRGTGPIAIEDTNPILHSMRLVKSQAELELMRKAAAISVEAHNYAQEIARPGLYEYEIQAEIERIFRLRGGMGPAYPSIVASGANACVLHYIENNRQIQDKELLLIDAGCAYGYYNGDITRTFPVGGKFTPEQKALYEIVLEAQLQAIAQVQPGNPYSAIHDTAVRVLTEGLVKLGILKGEIDKLIEEEKYKPFYMHRTGHWLGLDVHDVGVYQHGENPQILQPGQVLTVEPGLYIVPDTKPAEDQPEIAERWSGIGIRIEDDVLVTSTGHEVLTAGVPKLIEEIER